MQIKRFTMTFKD